LGIDEDNWLELSLLVFCGCLEIIFISESELVSLLSKKSNNSSSFDLALFKVDAVFKLII